MKLDDLIAFGANVDEGLQRCMNNEEFYLRLVETVKNEASFGALQTAVEAGDLDAAFEAAHALKCNHRQHPAARAEYAVDQTRCKPGKA